ncbi:hypothetical protein ILFOPFJJ_06541 [Ensifer psoraleae]|nr:hypothetical protein [Sinorhizobium psoraleae]
MLSPKLLEILRDYWKTRRPKAWLVPGDRAGQPITRDAVGQFARKRTTSPPRPNRDAAQFAARLRRPSPGGRC